MTKTERVLSEVGKGPSESRKWTDPEDADDVRRSNSLVAWLTIIVLMAIAYAVGRLT